MANLDSKQLLVALKAYSRANALPLDSTEVWDSMDEALNYAKQANAYAGQTIKVLVGDTYKSYNLYPTESGYELKEVGAVSASDLKQYVVVDDKLPESNQEQGIIYINTSDKTGSIWNGSAYVKVFKDVQADLDAFAEKVTDIETELDGKAPVVNPVFTGTVTVDGDEVALKSYVDGLISNLTSCAPSIVSSSEPLPEADYKAGQTFRVAEAGEYAGEKCEVGDLVIVVKNYNKDSASNDDFMILQANIDGAVTSVSDATTIGEIVVFDSVTGKVIKGSGLTIASLNESLAKIHEHVNKGVLDTYDKTQTELLESAENTAQELVSELNATVTTALDGKADKATTLDGYGILDAYTITAVDTKLQVITDNLNTKVSTAEVDAKIGDAKADVLEATSEALEERIGGIPSSTTIKQYVDSISSTGSADVSTAIAQAKQEAIEVSEEYTDNKLASALSIIEF